MTETLSLDDLGWGEPFQTAFAQRGMAAEIPARIVEEQRGAYFVRCPQGEFLATISGKLRHQAKRREDFPAVGDWAAILPKDKTATLQAILPRRNKLSRRASGQETDEQLIAANLDSVCIVTSMNNDFNARRIERYLSMIAESGAAAMILLTKSDLCKDPAAILKEVKITAPTIPVVAISAVTGDGLPLLAPYFQKAKSIALIGSSGVGKSTLVNRLIGYERQKVQEVRGSDDRGRHTTTFRRLIPLPNGGLLIDTPGMRELKLWDSRHASDAFEDILALIDACKFRDCKHRTDAGCAVQAAIKDGRLVAARYDNFLKLQQEAGRLASQLETDAERKANEKIKLARAAYKRERQ